MSGTADEHFHWNINPFAFSAAGQVLLMGCFDGYSGPKKMFLMGMTIRTASLEDGMLRNKALGLNGSLPSPGLAVGAVLGGVLPDLFERPFSSLMSFLVGLVVLGHPRFMIKDVAKHNSQKLEAPGAVTLTIDLLALVLGAAAIERAAGDP